MHSVKAAATYTVAASCSSAPMTSTSDPSVSFTMTPRDACTFSGLMPSSLSSSSYFGLQCKPETHLQE